MSHPWKGYNVMIRTKIPKKIVTTLALFIINFNAHTVSFTDLTEEQCHNLLNKASLFVADLQYRLVILSKNHIVAWVQYHETQWMKITRETSMILNYPITIHDISASNITLELVITPFCKKKHVLERQIG